MNGLILFGVIRFRDNCLLLLQLEDAEFAKIVAVKAKQGVEMELQELQHQLDDVIASKRAAEDRLADITREKNSLETKLEEDQEDLDDVARKYKAIVAQVSTMITGKNRNDERVEVRGRGRES